MKNINYKLIVSDFDGTLVSTDKKVSEENKKAILKYVSSGGIFAVSTGRLPSAILPFVREMGLKGFLCCGQGAIILDIETGEIVFEKRLSQDTTLSACKKMEEMGLHILAFDLWDFYSNMDNEFLKIYENITKGKGKIVKGKKMSEFLQEKQLAVYKLLSLNAKEDNQKVFEQLKAFNLHDCEITKSTEFLVEVVNKTYSKGTALLFLAEKYGIPLDKTIAIGDNLNDISMIKCAKLGVAVKNAEKALKEKADYVSEYTNDESAVAKIIQKFGFKN